LIQRRRQSKRLLGIRNYGILPIVRLVLHRVRGLTEDAANENDRESGP
jgi:hypothetical protein